MTIEVFVGMMLVLLVCFSALSAVTGMARTWFVYKLYATLRDSFSDDKEDRKAARDSLGMTIPLGQISLNDLLAPRDQQRGGHVSGKLPAATKSPASVDGGQYL